jgi:hypothetical protein
VTSVPQEELRVLVFDATCLSHFARADRLDVLRGLLSAEFHTPAISIRFAEWVRRIGAEDRDFGEASVFAIAEQWDGVAITDDRRAVAVARATGLEVHGTIWLLARACRDGKISEPGAGGLIDALRGTGHRLPCTGTEFSTFARRYKLL